MSKIIRSVPSTLHVHCEDIDFANGVKAGIEYALNNLLHECDVIIRVPPTIEIECINQDDEIYKYKVRSRFTAKSKPEGMERGRLIYTQRSFYEEEYE